MRRSTFTDEPVTYAAIGASLDPDLLRYPPTGFRPAESVVRLGSGRPRFESAVTALLTWGVQRNAGVPVSDIEAGTGRQYAGVSFDATRAPVGLNPTATVDRFAEDGTPYIAPGMKAVLHIKSGPLNFAAPVRVVFTIEEPDRVGYALGTLDGHPEDGETIFLVEYRDDESVWFTIRGFSRTSGAKRALAPLFRVEHDKLVKRYLRSLHPVGQAAPVAAASVADAELETAPAEVDGLESLIARAEPVQRPATRTEPVGTQTPQPARAQVPPAPAPASPRTAPARPSA
ncbi:DUF1990 family protein, partial [Agromyces seonyuensis]